MNIFNKLFSKKSLKQRLGIALRQQSLAFCYQASDTEVRYQEVKLDDKNHGQVLAELANEHQLEGQCHLILPVSYYQIVQIDKPNVPDEEIVAALKWQVKDLVPYSPENMILDYFDGPKLAGGMSKLNVVCAEKAQLKELVEAVSKGGLSPTMISTEEFAFASLLPKQDDACLLLCQQPNEEVIILIIKQGQLHFYRRLRGFVQLAQLSEHELNLGSIDNLSLEIQRSTDYFERQLKQTPIKTIKLILSTSKESYLAEKLAGNTHIPVSLLDLPEKHREQRELAVAIGAAMLNHAETKA